jgi:dimethylargininase
VFVEDTAVVLPEIAVIARPGAASRRAETTSVADALRAHRSLAFIEAPGTLDGGDVLRVGTRIYVGASARTNADGRRQLREIVTPHGYSVQDVAFSGCLHLKTAATQVAERTVLLNPDWIDATLFDGLQHITVHPREPFAANALRAGDVLLCASAHPHTRRRLEDHGIAVRTVEADELAKAEAGVTCCCILIP